jgi:phage terminase Nu1 subunit (DNA packaging protein)
LLVNKSELARQVLRCSLPALNDMIDRDPNFPIVSRGSNGIEWQFDPVVVQDYLRGLREAATKAADDRQSFLAQFRLPIDEIAPDGASELSPAARKALASARMAERTLALQTGLLVPTAEVRQKLHIAFGALAKRLGSLAKQIRTEFNLPEEVERSIARRIAESQRTIVEELRPLLEGTEAPRQ